MFIWRGCLLDAHEQIAHFAQQFRLDFDDAYQYALAERYNLIIVSFDSDFDRTPRGRKEPSDLITLP